MLDKHFKMKIPNNLLVAPLVCNLRTKSAFEELLLTIIHIFLEFLTEVQFVFSPLDASRAQLWHMVLWPLPAADLLEQSEV